jgi:glycogen synthase
MNIVFLSREYPPAPHGGIGTYTRTVGRAFAERGHHVEVVTWTDQEERTTTDGRVRVHWTRTHLIKSLCQRPLRSLQLYQRFPAIGEWIGWSYSAYRKVVEIDKHNGVDVVEAPDFVAQGYVTSFSRRLPLVVKLHNPISLISEQLGLSPAQGERLGWRFEAWATKRADVITSPSQALGSLLARRWGFEPVRVRLVPCPVDEQLFRPGAQASRTEPVILYVGGLGRTKGTRTLLDAFAHVLRDFPLAYLHLIGHDRSDRDIHQASYPDYVLEQYGREVADHVKYVGRLPHDALVGQYQACSVAVVPSGLFDNFPITCLEAMACGKPLVGTNQGGIPEIIQDGVTGLVVPPNEPVALAHAIGRVLRDPGLAANMGTSGRQVVEDKYAVRVVVDQTLSLYQEAAGKKARKW